MVVRFCRCLGLHVQQLSAVRYARMGTGEKAATGIHKRNELEEQKKWTRKILGSDGIVQ